MADASAEMKKGLKKAVGLETFITLAVIVLLFGYLGYVMGMDIVFSVMMKTSHDILMNTSFWISKTVNLPYYETVYRLRKLSGND